MLYIMASTFPHITLRIRWYLRQRGLGPIHDPDEIPQHEYYPLAPMETHLSISAERKARSAKLGIASVAVPVCRKPTSLGAEEV